MSFRIIQKLAATYLDRTHMNTCFTLECRRLPSSVAPGGAGFTNSLVSGKKEHTDQFKPE